MDRQFHHESPKMVRILKTSTLRLHFIQLTASLACSIAQKHLYEAGIDNNLLGQRYWVRLVQKRK